MRFNQLRRASIFVALCLVVILMSGRTISMEVAGQAIPPDKPKPPAEVRLREILAAVESGAKRQTIRYGNSSSGIAPPVPGESCECKSGWDGRLLGCWPCS